jgi:hypothetical protein
MLAVYKDSNVQLLDAYLGNTGNFQSALNLLNDENRSLRDITAATDAGITNRQITGEAQHFENHWLSDRGPLAGKHVDEVMRYGYKWAIQLASMDHGGLGERSAAVPIETFWVTTGPGGNFEIHVCDGEERVTVLVFIPVDREYGSRTGSNSWAVRLGGFGEHRPLDAPRVQLLHDDDDRDPSVVRVQTSGAAPAGSVSTDS